MTKKDKKKGSILKAIFLAFPFVIIYFIVRNLPVEPCEFLHEETYNAEGELDYCGADETGFVDLSVRKWPMTIDFRPLDALAVNQLCKFEIKTLFYYCKFVIVSVHSSLRFKTFPSLFFLRLVYY